jgi:acyl-CoA hydrolase
MNSQELYQKKLGTLKGALALLRPGDVLATACYGNEPSCFLGQLHTVAPALRDVKVWLGNTVQRYPFAYDGSLAGHVDILSVFFGRDCRDAHADKRSTLSPVNLRDSGSCIVNTKRPNIFVAAVSPMDKDGNVYMSFDLEWGPECLDAADTVIFEVNKNHPRFCGETAIPITRASYLYEVDAPLPYAPEIRSSPVEETIAGYVATLVKAGDCIQLGIGGTSNAVGRALTGKRDLGIHSEMITATMGELMRAGAVTNARKNINRGKTIGSFAFGDQALYDYLNGNEDVVFRRCSWVNDPFVIAQNDNFVSINTAMQVDLTGQICSESIGTRQYSGSGGAFDFAYGAYRSRGGRGIIAISSTTRDGSISKIQPVLDPGAVVTIPRNVSDYIVTEYGIARIRDRTVRERVDALVAISHPDFRAELRRQAERYGLW